MDVLPSNFANPDQTALLGHTGFVGSNLLAQLGCQFCFNSKNISDLAGRKFELIICAAVSAVKWQANRDPEGDWRGIEPLLNALSQVEARNFILISTVDVYPDPRGVDEDFDPTPVPNHTYGTHRLKVEKFVSTHFPGSHIVRLPGLFGPGLKKNVIYDLINNRELDAINPKSAFQYYDLARLSGDLARIVQLGIPLLNIATEPILTETILHRFFPEREVGRRASGQPLYDFRTRHASAWGGENGYLYSAQTVLGDLGKFLAVHSPNHKIG